MRILTILLALQLIGCASSLEHRIELLESYHNPEAHSQGVSERIEDRVNNIEIQLGRFDENCTEDGSSCHRSYEDRMGDVEAVLGL